jgi:putative transposase
VKAFLTRPIEGDWPYLWIDATYVKVRQNGRVVSIAVIVAVGVNSDGRREVLDMDIGPSEAETFWTAFLRASCRAAACAASSSSSRMPTRASRPPSPRCSTPLGSLSRAFHAQCARSCGPPGPPRRLRIHCHRIRPRRR